MKKLTRKSISVLLSLLMILSVFGGMAVLANAEDTDPPAPAAVTYKPVAAKDATCGDDGNIAYYKGSDDLCYVKNENDEYVVIALADTVIPATNAHGELTATAATDATCERDGNIAYWYCDTCKHYYSDAQGTQKITANDTVVPKLEHSFYKDTYNSYEPSCKGSGEIIYICETCGMKKVETYPMVQHADYDGNGECDWCGFTMTPGACRQCGKVHTGFFGKIVKFFHEAFWFINELLK